MAENVTVRTGDRAVGIDGAAVAIVSVAICVASQRVGPMTAVVVAVMLARLAGWMALPRRDRDHSRAGEVLFFSGCTVVGAFNDWNSVTRHHVYQYTVPLDLPAVSGLPVWMLLYWGLIVRFVVTLVRWRRLNLPPPGNDVRLGRRRWNLPVVRVGALLVLVAVTRQCIYRFHRDPVASWLPFAAALGLIAATMPLGRRRWAFLGAVLVAGPLVEVVYIRLGHLHSYGLGWLGGVPLWIALWWVMAVIVCEELTSRLSKHLFGGDLAPRSGGFEVVTEP